MEWFRSKHVNVLKWPSQSPDLNPIENLWQDLKIAVHRRSPSNLTELQLFCQEEWTNISISRCAKLRAAKDLQRKVVLPSIDSGGGGGGEYLCINFFILIIVCVTIKGILHLQSTIHVVLIKWGKSPRGRILMQGTVHQIQGKSGSVVAFHWHAEKTLNV